jgi:hypothetical protein
MILHYMILFVYGIFQFKLRLYQRMLLEIRQVVTSYKTSSIYRIYLKILMFLFKLFHLND